MAASLSLAAKTEGQHPNLQSDRLAPPYPRPQPISPSSDVLVPALVISSFGAEFGGETLLDLESLVTQERERRDQERFAGLRCTIDPSQQIRLETHKLVASRYDRMAGMWMGRGRFLHAFWDLQASNAI
jgi:hypothetical protein